MGLVTSEALFDSYRMARHRLGTGDLVLTISEQNPSSFKVEPRRGYVADVKKMAGNKPIPFFMRGIMSMSAHAMAELPAESDAFWLIVLRPNAVPPMPIMCAIFGVPYSTDLNETILQ